MGRVPGPFRYYSDIHPGVTAATIRASAVDPAGHAAALGALKGELEGDEKRVVSSITGDIQASVKSVPHKAGVTAGKLAASGLYATALVDDFARMVDHFDDTVEGINRDYHSRVGTAERAAAHDPGADHDAHAVRGAIQADLKPRYTRAEQKLDDDADSVATRFRQGPTSANVRELIRHGLLPLAAAHLYPGVHLTAADKRAARESASGPVARTLRFLGILPPDDMTLPAGVGWGAGVLGFGFGGLASWMSKGALGRWQPNFRLPNGMLRYQDLGPYRGWGPRAMWRRLKVSVRPNAAELDFHAPPYQGAKKALWDNAGKWGSRAGGVVTGLTSAWSQWEEDSDDPSLDTDDKLDRAATTGAATGVGAWAGAEGGAWAGGAIGTAICPGVGTVIGGAVGGLVGGAVGAWGGSEAADWVNDKADGVVHAAKDVGGWVGDKLGLW